MPRRSGEKTRDRYGVDSSGWNGDEIVWEGSGTIELDPQQLSMAVAASDTSVATLTLEGVPVVGAQLAVLSLNEADATVAVPAVTDVNGQTDIVVTGVQVGITAVLVSYAGASKTKNLAIEITA